MKIGSAGRTGTKFSSSGVAQIFESLGFAISQGFGGSTTGVLQMCLLSLQKLNF